MKKFMIFYTVLVILTIILSTINTFVYDKSSILNWAIDVILYSGLWGFVYVISKVRNK